jgi:uncharacterized RDD family membrane protein YckC
MNMEDQLLDQTYVKSEPTDYAGFWIRFGAAFIDGLITGLIGVAVLYGTGGSIENQSGLSNGFNIILGWLYAAIMESSERQATFGKIAVGIKVTDMNGDRISFGKATGRHFAKIISAIILLIGYIMAAFDSKKQALHDKMAGTLVLNK